MKRLRAVLAVAAAAAPLSIQAAEITRVASSFDENDPFGMYLDVAFERTLARSKITRETYRDGEVRDVEELAFSMVEHRLDLDLRIGIWQDLELRFGAPIIFSQDRTWTFARGTTPATSTIVNNCLSASGELLDPACPQTGAGAQPIAPLNLDPSEPALQTFRGGLGNLTFGLAYALYNQQRDDTKPTWIVGLDYEAPTAAQLDPTTETALAQRGNIGDRVHRYQFFTAFSRRMGAVDPYFRAHYTLPVRGPGWYSNCDNPGVSTMGFPQNCGTAEWARSDTGIKPPHEAGVLFGSEFVAFEDTVKDQKVALDLRGNFTYISEGRYYNEMSDVLNKLLYTQDYLRMGGSVGITAWAADYVAFQARASLLYNTEHLLTNEDIGKDIDKDGFVEPVRTDVPASERQRELNPSFDYRTDLVSRRFRAQDSSIFLLEVNARFSF